MIPVCFTVSTSCTSVLWWHVMQIRSLPHRRCCATHKSGIADAEMVSSLLFLVLIIHISTISQPMHGWTAAFDLWQSSWNTSFIKNHHYLLKSLKSKENLKPRSDATSCGWHLWWQNRWSRKPFDLSISCKGQWYEQQSQLQALSY